MAADKELEGGRSKRAGGRMDVDDGNQIGWFPMDVVVPDPTRNKTRAVAKVTVIHWGAYEGGGG